MEKKRNLWVIPTEKPSRLILQGSEVVLSKYLEINEGFSEFNQNIYITSDEKIKEGDYVIKISSLYKGGGIAQKYSFIDAQFEDIIFKKIILTTDQDLIKDGVHGIDDTFLEWFVKNPSCEWIEVIKIDVEQPKPLYPNGNHKGERVWIEQYKIIIPQEEPKHIIQEIATHLGKTIPETLKHIENFSKELDKLKKEPKQETLEEAAKEFVLSHDFSQLTNPNHLANSCFQYGAKWQAEQEKNKYSEEEVKDIVEQTIEKFYKHRYSDKTKSEMKELWFEQFKKK